MLKHNIKATHIELTDAIRAYVEKMLTALEKLIDPNDTSAHADIEVGKTTKHHQRGDVFRAEINIHIAGSDLRAVAKEEDLYAAIDVVRDDIMRRLRKEKTKRISLVRRGGRQFKKLMRRFGRQDYESRTK